MALTVTPPNNKNRIKYLNKINTNNLNNSDLRTMQSGAGRTTTTTAKDEFHQNNAAIHRQTHTQQTRHDTQEYRLKSTMKHKKFSNFCRYTPVRLSLFCTIVLFVLCFVSARLYGSKEARVGMRQPRYSLVQCLHAVSPGVIHWQLCKTIFVYTLYDV